MRIGLLGLLVLSSFVGVAQGEYITRTRVRYDPLAVPTTSTTPIPSVVSTTTTPLPGTSESVATSVTETGVNSTVGGWVPSTTTTTTTVAGPVYGRTRTRVRYGSTPVAPVITPPVVAIEPNLVGTPEPGSIALMAGGLGALILLRRRRS